MWWMIMTPWLLYAEDDDDDYDYVVMMMKMLEMWMLIQDELGCVFFIRLDIGIAHLTMEA